MPEIERRARPARTLELMRIVASDEDGGVVTEDVRLADPSGEDLEAWLVRPAQAEPDSLAGLVLWHWLDTEAPDGNRSEFLDEARGLAARGALALLPQGRFPWLRPPTGSAADSAEVEAEVARFGRLVDVLAGRADVDAGRIGAVGHDFGGMLAAIAAARDSRIASLALIAPTPRWGDWFLPFWPISEDRIDYLRAMRHLDPVEQLARVAPRPVLLQFGRRDFYIPLMAGFELRRAAASDETVELKAYDAEHDLRIDEASADRAAFLDRTLGIAAASEEPRRSG
jgi:dienelactone hydrolase